MKYNIFNTICLILKNVLLFLAINNHQIFTYILITFLFLLLSFGFKKILNSQNSNKENMFTLEQRKYFIESRFKNDPKIKVISYKGLTVDLCRKIGVNFIRRGARNAIDFEFEKVSKVFEIISLVDKLF